MEIMEFKKIEEINEKYSLNLNNIINELEKNPNKFQIIAYTDKQTLFQKIIVYDNLNESIFLEISDYHIVLSEKETDIEYCISDIYPDEIIYENEKIKEFEISVLYGSEMEIAINIQVITNNNGEVENTLLNGEANWENEKLENINVRFGKENFLDVLENDEYYNNDEFDDNEVDLEEEEDEFDNVDIEIFENEISIKEIEKDKELMSKYIESISYHNKKQETSEAEEIEDFEEEILEFIVSKNGSNENVSKEDFNKIVSNLSQISFQLLDDFDKRIDEIISIRKGISKILQAYKNNVISENNKIQNSPSKKEEDVER